MKSSRTTWSSILSGRTRFGSRGKMNFSWSGSCQKRTKRLKFWSSRSSSKGKVKSWTWRSFCQGGTATGPSRFFFPIVWSIWETLEMVKCPRLVVFLLDFFLLILQKTLFYSMILCNWHKILKKQEPYFTNQIDLLSESKKTALAIISEQCLACFCVSKSEKKVFVIQEVNGSISIEKLVIPQNSFFTSLWNSISFNWKRPAIKLSIEASNHLSLVSYNNNSNSMDE